MKVFDCCYDEALFGTKYESSFFWIYDTDGGCCIRVTIMTDDRQNKFSAKPHRLFICDHKSEMCSDHKQLNWHIEFINHLAFALVLNAKHIKPHMNKYQLTELCLIIKCAFLITSSPRISPAIVEAELIKEVSSF